MEMGSSSTPGKQQSQSLKDIVIGGGKPSNSFSEKNPDLSSNEASSSDAVSSAAATSTTPNQGGKPSSVSSPHQQPMSASLMGKHEVKQEIDGTPAAPSFPPSRHNSISSVANTPAEVRKFIYLFVYVSVLSCPVCLCICVRDRQTEFTCTTMHFILASSTALFTFYQVKQEAVKMESSSPASHMSPAVRKTSSAGMLIKSEGKIPKKGT